MKVSDCLEFDHIVIGSGVAGLSSALHLAEAGGSVAIITKSAIDECNTKLAQGGIACVLDKEDTFESHIQDTLYAGAGLCKEDVVRKIIETGRRSSMNLLTAARILPLAESWVKNPKG